MEKTKTAKLTESAVLIAIATILSFYKFFDLPNGGSITALSMVPLIILSYRNGIKWGFFAGSVFGMIQLLIGISALKGISIITVIGSFFLDYLFAFGILGIAGIFKNSRFNPVLSLGLGAFIATSARFIFHFLSGFLLWSDILNDGFSAVIYSFTYNISYMGFEIVFTSVACALLGGSMAILNKNNQK